MGHIITPAVVLILQDEDIYMQQNTKEHLAICNATSPTNCLVHAKRFEITLADWINKLKNSYLVGSLISGCFRALVPDTDSFSIPPSN